MTLKSQKSCPDIICDFFLFVYYYDLVSLNLDFYDWPKIVFLKLSSEFIQPLIFQFVLCIYYP